MWYQFCTQALFQNRQWILQAISLQYTEFKILEIFYIPGNLPNQDSTTCVSCFVSYLKPKATKFVVEDT